ncbi:replication initiator [Streptomyces sp. NPDC029674]|uniref:replication initiator n=1 Tax=Streptomyces sp. NPDC029674 TaxID=3365297 RepID=UPI003850ADEB
MYPATDEARRSVLTQAERLRLLSSTERDLIRLVHEPGFPRWLDQIKAIGGCAHPIYLSGHTTVRDVFSGSVLRRYSTEDEPGGRMPVRCRNRRESRCQPCARLHAGDTFQLVRSGLLGGKGVADRVQRHPRLFVTLTAPSFGPVHRVSTEGAAPCRPRRRGGHCGHGRPRGCGQHHADTDPALGQPLCRDCYDYAGHVLWHASAGALWSRFCHTLRRRLATAAGIVQTRFREHAALSFAKVAEYQKRGAIHFHAVIRLDGPDGPSSPPPLWATTDALEAAVRSAAASVEVQTPYSAATGERAVRWGAQLDVHTIRSDAFTQSAVTDSAVAAYVAKYVSKSVGDAGGVDYRITDYESVRLAPVDSHLRALMGVCWRLGGLPELDSLNLRSWTHTLGYRGHVLTKSRRYSTTYGELRAARTRYLSGVDSRTWDDGTTVTESAWRYVGSGHSPAEAELAAGIAEDRARSRELAGQDREWGYGRTS